MKERRERKMSEIKLKPCPFCGGEAEFVLGEEYREEHKQSKDWIQCSSCGIETPYFDTPEKAAEAWNRREGEQNESS